jgi:hypothetical protein
LWSYVKFAPAHRQSFVSQSSFVPLSKFEFPVFPVFAPYKTHRKKFNKKTKLGENSIKALRAESADDSLALRFGS